MSLKQDCIFGLQKEHELIDVLGNAFNVDLTKTAKYASIDFKSDTIDIELKSRKNAHDTYRTTMIPKSKVDYIKHQLIAHPEKSYIFAFSFTDGLYFIKYDSSVFDTFECKMFVRNQRIDYNDKQQLYYFIPIDKLEKINDASSVRSAITRDA